MLVYISGKVISIQSGTIVLENNWKGYLINVPNPSFFEVGKSAKLHLHIEKSLKNSISQISEVWYGFHQWKNRQVFMKLLKIPSIGAKTALTIMSNCDDDLEKLLKNSEDAKKISEALKIKINQALNLLTHWEGEKPLIATADSPVIDALEKLGYSQTQIKFALNKLSNETLNGEDGLTISIREIALNNVI